VTKAGVPAIALLPVRLFFGVTFLYAGLDKLLDPTFFDPSAATSLHAQLEAFARFSPLGELIRVTLPLAAPIGLLIALAEIGIGLGALTGLAYRIAAAGGAALSLLLWLTASWSTHPYYLGADLPYAFGWMALALAGHGDVLVPTRLRGDAAPDAPAGEIPGEVARGRSRRRRLAARSAAQAARGGIAVGYSPATRAGLRYRDDLVPSPERRALLQAGLLAGIAAIVASITLPLRALGIMTERGVASDAPAPTASPAAPGAGGATATPTVPGGAPAVATVAQVKRTGAAPFTVPFDAPAPLPAGDPGVIVQLADGSFVAFDAVCTHAGCTVEWDRADSLLFCPCHGAAFDPEHEAAVLQGPARAPLARLPIVIDQASGSIYLSG